MVINNLEVALILFRAVKHKNVRCISMEIENTQKEGEQVCERARESWWGGREGVSGGRGSGLALRDQL